MEPNPPDFTDYMRKPATEELSQLHPRHAARTRYIDSLCGMPAWTNTEAHYFRAGEDMFASMCEELEKAERFIFLEYFIIEEGKMWNTILDILARKAKKGLDVRIIYDDVGSIATLPQHYDRYLVSLGIRAVRFNRFIPTLNTYLNYRNHRKMMIIDGNVGYMGGINLADEYINEKVRFGYWNDTGILLRCRHGEHDSLFPSRCGVCDGRRAIRRRGRDLLRCGRPRRSFQMWEYVTGEKITAFKSYLPTVKFRAGRLVQPFADSPLDDLNIGESTYLQIIHNARKYVYITTPYLVLDNEMITALTIAAQSGVDVRILTPGIPDKKLVYMITRSYYQQLHRAGVKIYEYRPGFLHAKSIVSDDDTAVVGTINMDFRSFFLHFECATCFYNSSVVASVKQDILETINVSRRIDDAWLRRVPWLRSIAASVLRLFAPLL